MKSYIRITLVVIVGLLIFQLAACSGTEGVGNEAWTLVEIATQGERTDTFTDVVKVQNCGIVQPKTITCSAGTTNDLSIGQGGSVGFGEGINYSISASVSKGLGIGRESGENVELETPPVGSTYVFTINKEYRVTTGDLIAQSSGGKQQTVSYNFDASCSIQVVSRYETSCSETNQDSKSEDMPGLIVEVYANQDWQDTGLFVEKGNLLTIEYVSGLWAAWPDRYYDAQGVIDGGLCQQGHECILFGVLHLSLIGRIDGTEPFYVGNRITLLVQETGNVLLRANDSRLDDNSGSLVVRVTLRPPP